MNVEPEGIQWNGYTGKGADGKDWIRVTIAKASDKGDPGTVAVCVDMLPENVYWECMVQGAKALAERGMTKIAGRDKSEANRQAALDIAQQNVENMYAGKVRMTAGAGKGSKLSGAEKTEAMRLARLLVKDRLKAAKFKVSHYKQSEISALAAQVLEGEHGATILAEARRNLAQREAKATEITVDLAGLKPDEELVKKAQSRAKTRSKKPSAEAIAAATGKGKGEARATKH